MTRNTVASSAQVLAQANSSSEALQRAQARLSELGAAGIDAQRAKSKLDIIPEHFLAALEPLRGAQDELGLPGLRAAAERHPLEALALVLNAVDDQMARVEGEIQARTELLESAPSEGLAN